ncbi:MAG: SPOR domain-containing protein [Planctomycetota bacterium]
MGAAPSARPELEPTVWTWLNQAVALRRATVALVVTFVLLVIAGAYLAGGGGVESSSSVQERLFIADLDEAPWAPLSRGPHVRKHPIRSVQAKNPVAPSDARSIADGTAAEKTFAVVVSQSTELEASDRLALYLDKQGVGAPVGMDTKKKGNGEPLFRVYFGPFATKAQADECLQKVKRIGDYGGTSVSKAIVLPGPFGEEPRRP